MNQPTHLQTNLEDLQRQHAIGKLAMCVASLISGLLFIPFFAGMGWLCIAIGIYIGLSGLITAGTPPEHYSSDRLSSDTAETKQFLLSSFLGAIGLPDRSFFRRVSKTARKFNESGPILRKLKIQLDRLIRVRQFGAISSVCVGVIALPFGLWAVSPILVVAALFHITCSVAHVYILRNRLPRILRNARQLLVKRQDSGNE